MFFVISGFIMVHASAPLFTAPGGGRTFLARRIARIVPIYWAVTTLYLAIALAVPEFLNREFLGGPYVVASYLFIPATRPDGLVQPLYGLGWTLNYEMFFYALFALALGRSRRAAVLGLAAVLAALVAIGRALGPLPEPLRFWTDPIILEFVYGMALGLIYAEGVRLGPVPRALLSIAALAMLVAVATRHGELATAFRALAYGIPAAMLVAALAFGRGDGTGGRLGPGGRRGRRRFLRALPHPSVRDSRRARDRLARRSCRAHRAVDLRASVAFGSRPRVGRRLPPVRAPGDRVAAGAAARLIAGCPCRPAGI